MERIPISKVGDHLLVSIQTDLHDQMALNLQDDLSQRIKETKAHGVLIDISSLTIVDSFTARVLNNIAAMARLFDAEAVVVGMQPAVAITLVELGLTLKDVHTAMNMDKGLALLQRLTNKAQSEKLDETTKDGE